MTTTQSASLPLTAYAEAIATVTALFGAPLEQSDLAALRLLPANSGPLAALAGIDALRPGVETAVKAVCDLPDIAQAESVLNTAFCRLFLGSGGPMSAPPYESAYQGSGRLYQEPAGEMALLLRRRGRGPAEDFPEAPDHLVIELSLLSEALELAAASGNVDDTEVANELLARLRRWVPDFAAACQMHDTTGFYAASAGVLERLLNLPILGTASRAA
ncbi:MULTISPECIES: molecular chaperone TorD family protein [Rhodopseudomonas]|uniref:molecular chaperone TorD family protein n=1 Tax=Rhodopseudomonas TaxID=1073 RepID=UPI000697C505|nr:MULTISPECIES: molecular chaperone TorD family protein [Rhodopseudomonas]MDF3810317.1 molecular chaperone TorD family protein [Rhodopseudomonas sp. BAL398]WOK19891.1 molecular chaperone TorD family protein [Rhodopseudomonas sp. BAL398]